MSSPEIRITLSLGFREVCSALFFPLNCLVRIRSIYIIILCIYILTKFGLQKCRAKSSATGKIILHKI